MLCQIDQAQFDGFFGLWRGRAAAAATIGAASAEAVGGDDRAGVDAEIAAKSKKPVGQPYNQIKQAALQDRKNAQPGETPASMRNLYRFWSQMLPKDFNSGVYTEFRDLAIADVNASTPSLCGIKHLLGFYRKLIYDTEGRKPWPQGRAMPGIFQLHFNEALELERAYSAHTEASI